MQIRKIMTTDITKQGQQIIVEGVSIRRHKILQFIGKIIKT